MKKILVTGATGQLGSELLVLSRLYPQYKWIFADRTKVSLNDLKLLYDQLNNIQPDVIFNCGAYTAVDKAESDQEMAFTINHLAVQLIAQFTFKNSIKLIHISTDYVFDGTSSIALDEEAETNPINIYGESKRAGELSCLKENPNSIIIRTSWVFSNFGNNFVKTMQRLMKEKELINVVNDQIGSPTYAADLALAMLKILETPNWIPGIFNYSNLGEISWYDFALDIRNLMRFDCDVIGISSSLYPTSAKRPEFSLLDKRKIKSVYNVDIPNYKDSLIKMILS